MGLGLAALVISGLLLWKARNRGYLITGWFWFLIAAAPVTVMLFVSGRPVEDHHLYIPLIGVFIMMAFGLSDFLAPFRNGRGLFLITASVITIALTAVSVSQVKHWENSLTVFQQALSVHPDNKKARVNLGDACLEKGRVEEAERHYRRFLDIAPDSALGHTKLAQSLALLGRPEDARRHLETALRLSPDYVPALHGLADLLAGLGKTDQAIALYRRALEINAGLFQTHNNLALALYDQGHFQEALAHLDQAIRLKPDYRTAIENRRVILGTPYLMLTN
jgi:tetratricopeptide (TPR) repeat protein